MLLLEAPSVKVSYVEEKLTEQMWQCKKRKCDDANSIFTDTTTLWRRRQWHSTLVLLPGKSLDGGAWWAAVQVVSKSWIRLSDFTFTFHFHALEKEMATHSSVLAWRIPGTGEPVGLPSMGSHRVGHDWSDLAAAAAAAALLYETRALSVSLPVSCQINHQVS